MHYDTEKGFTLVELAFVLVIIALIVGGVLVGQHLIRASELRKVVRDMESFTLAINAFEMKYKYLPGDFPEATTYITGCTDIAGSSCNGDGNGFVDNNTSGSDELRRAWEHLSRTNMIPGRYDGASAQITDRQVVATELSATAWVYLRYVSDGSFWPDAKVGNAYWYHMDDPGKAQVTELQELDNKLDDNNGLTGTFRIWPEEVPSPNGCMDIATGIYDPVNAIDTNHCHIVIYDKF